MLLLGTDTDRRGHSGLASDGGNVYVAEYEVKRMPRVTPGDLDAIGSDLQRPECVALTSAGEVVVSNWRGGVTIIGPDGSQLECLAGGGAFPLRPNGVACTADGEFLVAHLGDDEGGAFRLGRDGTLRPLLTAIGGVPLPPTNFVTLDAAGRAWISISTRHRPRQRAWRPDVADGFIVVVDRHGARVAADGLHYANEVRPDPTGQWIYAVETFGRRLVRFRLGADGSLGPREVVVALGEGWFPDGFAFDVQGGIWLTSLVSNRVGRVGPGGDVEIVLEEVNAAFVEAAEGAFVGGTMQASHLGRIPGTRLQHVTSLAFGGPDGATVHLGTLHGTDVPRFRAGVAGVPPTIASLAAG
jgi:sugar lactone lactonase YvrE